MPKTHTFKPVDGEHSLTVDRQTGEWCATQTFVLKNGEKVVIETPDALAQKMQTQAAAQYLGQYRKEPNEVN